MAKNKLDKIVSDKNMKLTGKWSFIGGLVLVVLASFLTGYVGVVALLLFVLGLAVGFLNISEKDSQKFLLGAVALLLGGVATINAITVLGAVTNFLGSIMTNFVAFVGASSLVVAIKVIFETGRD